MAYGVTSGRAHLNPITPIAPAANEINWPAIVVEWKNDEPAAFAGRYFLGTPTQAEVDAGTGFCLWAHGEGMDAWVTRIVPLQRADPDRQQVEGQLGADYGSADASALSTYIQRCLDVGDLELPPNASFVLVFLEVADATRLSVDYWLAWSTTIGAALVDPAPRSSATRQMLDPLFPAIACAFSRDNAQSPYLPETPVRDCLSREPPAGLHNRCYGLWCRTVIANPVFGEYVQDPAIGRVPVCYWRTFDGPAGTATPAGAPNDVLGTLPLITVDEPATGADDPTQQTLRSTAWTAADRPVQCGVDTNKNLTNKARCIASAEIVVRRLPSGNGSQDFGQNLDADLLREPGTFAFRYYSTRSGQPINSKDLKRNEAIAISHAKLGIAVVWEAFAATYKDIRDHFLAAGQGRTDANNAFLYAAETIDQPPYTPVYFAIDFPPGDLYGDADNSDAWVMPSVAQVLDYFRDVHRGYRDYLRAHPSKPYYIGIYAQASVCGAVYQAGLATHFWQPWPPSWGDNWEPFPHLNAWQIVLDATEVSGATPDLWDDNAAVKRCTNVDLDVAWGDPGAWQVY